MDELRDLMETLMSVPSHEDETVTGDAIEAWLCEEVDADVARGDVGSVVARINLGVGESLALVSHHDVVPPADRQTTDSDDYVVETRDGRLYSRGAADMKGAVAASTLAFRDAAADVDSGVAFASFVGEEIGGEGIRAAFDDDFELDYAVATEGSTNYSGPNRTDTAVARWGCRVNTLVTSGTACYTSGSERGENAVYRATDTVDAVHGLSVSDVKVLDHPIPESITVIETDSENAWDVIPGHCEMTLDGRTIPGGFADLVRTAELEGAEWVAEQDPPPMACDDTDFAERVLDAARSAHETRSDAESGQMTEPHATDARWLAQAGMTCVIYGPSEPGEAHTKDESVSFDVLARCYGTYRALVANR